MGRWGMIPQGRTPMLFAGRLRHKIDIVTPSAVQDSTGGTSLLVNTLWARISASVEAIDGSDSMANDSELSGVTHQIVIRYIGNQPSWLAANNYLGRAMVKDSNGNLQQAQGSGGLSGATAPTWNPTQGGTTSDGDPSTGVTWLNLGVAPQRTGVSSRMQVQFQGRQFQILNVQNPNERTKMLILLCIELNDSNQQTPLS